MVAAGPLSDKLGPPGTQTFYTKAEPLVRVSPPWERVVWSLLMRGWVLIFQEVEVS
jgi:hypothetical protein